LTFANIDFLHCTEVQSVSNQVIVIVGPRRSGKTYFLYQQIQELLKRGISRDRIIYLNFEDERLLPFSTDQLQLIAEAYFELFPKIEGSLYFFFDEIKIFLIGRCLYAV